MSLEQFSLEGRKALVTGASRGIGRACAVGLARAGADVALVSRGGALKAAAGEIEKLGRRALVLQEDLTRPETADKVVEAAVREFGRLDILVNNAGTTCRSPAENFTNEDWAEVLELNLNAVFRLCRAAGRVMLDQGYGKIVNVASLMSFQGGITIAAYTASKAGVAGLTRALANEWAGRNITVNALAPGYVRTEVTAPLQKDPVRSRQILERIPQGRWAEPEDMVGAVIFLASEASRYVQGHLLVVDGGWLSR
ncbi:MAG: 2-deoxy-D-gluconate 3-dehydrogenase [Candidatus Glassbacteria bacterium RIFCSPLOWO2_12_FULL_58_11]|uniref:2-deoxy-D-gluconate 3-dehydrogenase n=2 Tax=Candidatus Glassiibacteriota TaxID=1817805 RepID=A0A1F5YZZ4_9BACT|nr:MAG: 2-deoxy-D-gluconate 3-dehydrogenase [Candidatus Glassbacteria bacterium GWA2_58_10]OGG05790.1 MAG: 2-deoxy-D-gluconate 3-dehydrogenase [Candidatus Glassbacteria bacterium RIFCSPLOWO2_12_FULL_58_11]